jgi:uncharacterized membrane protein YcaP (DUF421 family)
MEPFPYDDAVILFNGWAPIIRILVVGTLTYFWILLLLRISGQRTLATMKAFDLIITIAMGAAFGRILTAREVPLAEAFTTFVLLVVLQTLLAWLQVNSKGFAKLVTTDPVLLYHNGRVLDKALRAQRIRESELMGVVRKEKFASLDQVEAIILESDGSFSVIGKAFRQGGESSYAELS